jgi:hypothetical protein
MSVPKIVKPHPHMLLMLLYQLCGISYLPVLNLVHFRLDSKMREAVLENEFGCGKHDGIRTYIKTKYF